MGFKTLKTHYRIGHIVQVTGAGICIGSPYIHDIIVIGFDGTILKRYKDDRSNADLHRYQFEFDTDPAELREVVQCTDKFDRSIPVYTWDDGEIIEEWCEEVGFPNVTHAGHMMYDNTYSTDKNKVIAWAKRDMRLAIKFAKERIRDNRKELNKDEKELGGHMLELAKLMREYPTKKKALPRSGT